MTDWTYYSKINNNETLLDYLLLLFFLKERGNWDIISQLFWVLFSQLSSNLSLRWYCTTIKITDVVCIMSVNSACTKPSVSWNRCYCCILTLRCVEMSNKNGLWIGEGARGRDKDREGRRRRGWGRGWLRIDLDHMECFLFWDWFWHTNAATCTEPWWFKGYTMQCL